MPGGHRPALGLRCRWATSHRDVAAPKGGAKSRLPLWGRWTRVSEDGEGKAPAAPSHGLCGSAGGLPSQSPNGDSVSAAASVGRWATSHRDVAAPKGEPSLASPFGGRWCPVGTVQRLVSAAASVGDGRSPLGCITRAGRRECHAFGMTERATRPRRARAPVVRTGVSVAHRPKARIDSGGTPPVGKGASLFP